MTRHSFSRRVRNVAVGQKPVHARRVADIPGRRSIHYAEYINQILRRAAYAGLLAVIAVAALHGMALMGSGSENQPHFVFAPLGAATISATYGILAAFVIAVQFSARATSRAEKIVQPGATSFIGLFAMMLMVCIALLCIVALFGLGGIPKTVDAYRVFGTILLSALLILPAAEASMLADLGSEPRVRAVGYQIGLAEIWEAQSRIPGVPMGGRQRVAQGALVFLVAPVLLAFAVTPLGASGDPERFLLRVAIAGGAAIVSFFMLKHLVSALAGRDWSTAMTVLVVFVIVVLSFVMTILTQSAASQANGDNPDVWSLQPTARAMAAFILVMLGPLLVQIPLCFIGPKGSRGLVLDFVGRSYGVKLEKIVSRGDLPPRIRRINRIAILSLFLFLIFPFGLVSAYWAAREIRRSGERGATLVRLAYVLSGIWCVGIAGVVVFLMLVPSELTFCGTDGGVCWRLAQ
ncbi:hypothetical protein [Sinomonas sp. P47F7]|uniref:hypothetical protein n=1 Tax=Sinomonas sp. P47F7 TaxID=3410987 RepID=UPI003BF4F15C